MLDFYAELTQHLLVDIARLLNLDLSRDILTFRNRVRQEGIGFLTKTMPLLGKSLDSYLASGQAPTFEGFALDRNGIPKFLGSLISLVYPTVKSVSALRHLRQVLYLFYKLELPFKPHQVDEFAKRFIETDESLPTSLIRADPVLDCASDLIARVCHTLRKEDILPKHGPGSVAEGVRGYRKMENLHFIDSCETEFPFFEWCVPSLSAVCDNYRTLSARPQAADGTAKVLFVPKDSRGPRVISCEPVTLQYLQQGIMAQLVSRLESCPLTKGRVNFRDQTVNQRYAYLGSLPYYKDGRGYWVTLDMKDASDRVSVALVKRLFSKTHILPWLLSTRSKATRLPDGTVRELKKFAPMGSAVCFPVEALIFWALAVAVLVHHVGLPLTEALPLVKVYGDDIICRSEDYAALLQYFPYVGLKFNDSKCCITGLFRESCGLDVYNGVQVTPIKIRTLVPSSKKHSDKIESWAAYQRSLFLNGYHGSAEVIQRRLDEFIRLPILDMLIRDQSSLPLHERFHFSCIAEAVDHSGQSFTYLLGFLTDWRGMPVRYNPDLCRREVYTWRALPLLRVIRLRGYDRLHWFFTGRVFPDLEKPQSWQLELGKERSRRPQGLCFPVRSRVSHKLRWCGIPHGA
jgi:hypothetical protein